MQEVYVFATDFEGNLTPSNPRTVRKETAGRPQGDRRESARGVRKSALSYFAQTLVHFGLALGSA